MDRIDLIVRRVRPVRITPKDRAFAPVAIAVDAESRAREPDGSRAHPIECERARFVGTNDGRGAEGLDRRELFEDRPVLGHPPHADRQGDGDDGRQALGDRRHCEGYGGNGGLRPGQSARQVEEKDQGDDDPGDRRQALAERIELTLQRGSGIRGLGNQPGEPADLGGHAGADDQHLGPTARHYGVHVEHVQALGQRRIGRVQGLRALADRLGLPGQGGLVDLQVGCRQQAPVRGHAIACLEQDEITGHQLGCFDLADPTVPAHASTDRDHRLERGECALRTVLLIEAERGIQDHDDQDDHGVFEIPDRPSQRGREEENDHQDVSELIQESEPERARLGLGESVLAVTQTSHVRLGRGETPRGIHVQHLDRLGDTRAVPLSRLHVYRHRPSSVSVTGLAHRCSAFQPDQSSVNQPCRASTSAWAWARLEMLNFDCCRYSPPRF